MFLPLLIFLLNCFHVSRINTFFIYAGIRVQSLNKGQIIMDIDFRWGGDPNIVLAVEALVASIPIQVRLTSVFPCWIHIPIGNFSKFWVLLAFASVEGSPGFHHYPCYIPTCWWDSLHFCCCRCPTCWGNFWDGKMKKGCGGWGCTWVSQSPILCKPFRALLQIKQNFLDRPLNWSCFCSQLLMIARVKNHNKINRAKVL